jgi:flagellar hook-basal body protein
VGTTGFKRSRADFGDIFATSPLQKASSTVGQGVSLKQVSQEFSQGNISFSSNALDLAVTGDGFFPMRSADGLQELFTRNGSFLLNEQFNVVNSSGQRLMAATVDSTGSANINERVVLTIPQKTSGDAKQTSLVSLGLNFPADAEVITEPFNRSNPATYNKSTAFTVYDNGGNGYLATIYYTKTSNANQNVPFNKWQTNVFVGEDQVAASLVQATDANNERIYVNQYGQTKPYSEVKDELTTAKTQLFSLDELTNKKISIAATATGNIVPETGASSYDWVAGLPNGDATRKDTIIARSHDPLAIAHQSRCIQVGKPWCCGLIADRNGTGTGGFAHDWHPAITIGQKQNTRGIAANSNHATNQTILVHYNPIHFNACFRT